jgi:riboflavin synthase
MFTGIVEETGSIQQIRTVPGGRRLDISASRVLEGTNPGDSILVDGVCLTVERVLDKAFTAFLSSETVGTTTLGEAAAGFKVNLERALLLGDRFGGHLVSGHVEVQGRIRDLRREGEGYYLAVDCPSGFGPYIVPKGSVSVNGVSLTMVEDLGQAFSVSMIPETFEKTTFRLKTPGNFVNLEPDLILKYVMSAVRKLTNGAKDGTLSIESLKKAGFIAD